MKSLKTIAVTLFTLFLGITSTVAQDLSSSTILTAEQLALLQAQKDLITANREAFKATLSAEQLAILENTDLDKKEQKAALAATFTDAQKTLLQENRESVKALKDEFKTSLTDEQRQELRSQNSGKSKGSATDGTSDAISDIKKRSHKRN